MNKHEEIRKQLVIKALEMAGEQGWTHIKLSDLALACEVTPFDIGLYFEEKGDILTAFGRMVDSQVFESMGQSDVEMPCRDALFDVLMERFDVLNEYRSGVTAVLESFRCDPKQAVIACPHLFNSMSEMMAFSGIETDGIRGALKVAGLSGLYLKVLKTWKDDHSPDMGKTMAALDQALGRAERVVNMLVL